MGLIIYNFNNDIRNGFKIVIQVQGQGGSLNLAGGILLIFRGLNSTGQRRDWA